MCKDTLELINAIWKTIPEPYRKLRIELYPDKEIMFSIYESEVDICVNLESNSVYIYSKEEQKLTDEMIREIYNIMQLIRENINVLKEWIK